MSNTNWKLRSLIGSLGFAVLAMPALAAEQPWVTKSNENAKLLLNVVAKYSPENATELGVDGFDEQITDMSRDLFEATNKDVRAVIAQLQQRLKGETDPKVRQDLEILIKAGQDQLRSAALKRKYLMPYVDVGQLLFGVVRATLDPRIPK
jgi:hypothetical protein